MATDADAATAIRHRVRAGVRIVKLNWIYIIILPEYMGRRNFLIIVFRVSAGSGFRVSSVSLRRKWGGLCAMCVVAAVLHSRAKHKLHYGKCAKISIINIRESDRRNCIRQKWRFRWALADFRFVFFLDWHARSRASGFSESIFLLIWCGAHLSIVWCPCGRL